MWMAFGCVNSRFDDKWPAVLQDEEPAEQDFDDVPQIIISLSGDAIDNAYVEVLALTAEEARKSWRRTVDIINPKDFWPKEN
jgi:hypothetical protein